MNFRDIPPDTARLGLFTGDDNPDGRVEPRRIHGGAARIRELLHQARALGNVAPSGTPGAYAVLDLADDTGDIVHDFAVPTGDAHRWWTRRITSESL